jgi:hypothetical protein
MEPELLEQVDLLYHAPEGVCLEVGPGLWLVRGKTKSYEIVQDGMTCSCPHYEHRLNKGDDCRHTKMLREFLKRGDKTCPCCKGEGCAGCGGQGMVSSELHPILLEIQRAEDEARVALIKEWFR